MGAMVAHEDLGAELPVEEVPSLQVLRCSCMAYWPSQELLSGYARCSMDLLFQEMMIYGCCQEYRPSHAAACALEALKLVFGCSRSVSNYIICLWEPHTVCSGVFTCSMYGSCSSLLISTHQSDSCC
ncbi:uncharacterized protein [Lolium perenne]|uniref:uncharacterized protein isoform X2 n=1 Tax=Lolium perenne TaxID=4522 RepID=UPI003A99572D